jgi:hypothetical protein
MAYDLNVVAIRWRDGGYAVTASATFNQGIDWPRLCELAPLRDVSLQPEAYIDQAAVLSRAELQGLLTNDRARVWFYGQAAEADFFLIHRAEWESGLSE